MAEQILKTRIKLLVRTYEEWTTTHKDDILLKGEIGFCTIENKNQGAQTAPTILFKVGTYDGADENTKKTFSQLKWASALAADVYDWAKVDADTFLAWLGEQGVSNNTTYNFSIPTTGNDAGKLLVEKKEVGETAWTKVGAYDFVTPGELETILADYYTKEELNGKIHTAEEIKGIKVNNAGHADTAGQANTAESVVNPLTIKVGKAEISYDGSAAKTADIDTAIGAALEAAKDYTDEVKKGILGEGISETYDTLKEIEDWIKEAGADAVDLAEAIAAEAETRREADEALSQEISDLANGQVKTNKEAIEAINNTSTGILAAAKAYADDLADNYATAAQGEKADSALQEIEVDTGLKVSTKANNKQVIGLDDTCVFILDCN